MSLVRSIAWLLALLVSAGCSRRTPRIDAAPSAADAASPPSGGPAAGTSSSTASASIDAAPELEPLTAPSWMIDLVEEGDGGAKKQRKLGVLAPPIGARARRPIMIALHGGSDRPEWACNAWRAIANAYPFLVCPRGVGNDAALAWSSQVDTKARVLAAIAATKRLFGSWIRGDAPIVLVGFSMGATQAALLAQAEPMLYRRVALAESAYAPEPVMTFARPWAAGGGERAIFLCTTIGCEATYRNAARNVARHHVPARLNIAGTTEHGMWNQVVQSMRRDWPWVIEGAPGWEDAPPEKGIRNEDWPGKTETFEASPAK